MIYPFLLGSAASGAEAAPYADTAPGTARAENDLRAAPSADKAPPSVPVLVELDISDNPGDYRDAVAELARSSEFRLAPGARPALREQGSRVAVRGRVPAAGLRRAVSAPRVTRLELGGAAPPGGGPAASAEFDVSLRLPPGLPVLEYLAGSLKRLKARSGFEFLRVVSARGASGVRAGEVVVSGRQPLARLGKLLADPAVLRVRPAPGGPRQPPWLSAAAGPGPPARWLASSPAIERRFYACVGALLLIAGVSSLRGRREKRR